MTAAAVERRGDPFAVPSGTSLRFALLMLSTTAVVMMAATGRIASLLTGDDVMRRIAAYQACWEREHRRWDGFPSGDRPSAAEVCGADPRVVQLWVPTTAVLVFWALVFVIYWFLPAWRIRHRRYVPLVDELPEVARALEELRDRSGTEPVSWYAEPLNPRVSALAFGRWRRRHIVLSGGLLALRTSRPETYEAVLLHELAHIRNRDVDISFLTIVVGRVALPVLLFSLPTGIGWPLIWNRTVGSFAEGAAGSLQILCLLVVVPLARRAVLRSREFYADARAQQWSISPDALRSLFDKRDTRRRLSGGLLRVHPTPARRLAMLANPEPLFRSGLWEMAAVGCVLGVLYTELNGTYVLNSALGDRADAVSGVLAHALVGTLCAAVVGFLALRADEGFPGAASPVLRAPAWGLACGMALGGGVANGTIMFALATTDQNGAGFLLWTGLLALAAFLAGRWMSRTVRLWRRALPHRRRPMLTLCGLVVAAGVMFACVLQWLLELMVTQPLMATVVGRGTPEAVTFVLGAVTGAGVRAPYLLCAVTLAALLPLLGQAAAYGGPRRDLRLTLGGGVRWGLWLLAGVTLLGYSGLYVLGLLIVPGALLVLVVRTGRLPRDGGLAFAHAVLAGSLAGVLALGGAGMVLALTGCGMGQCYRLDLYGTAAFTALSVLLALVIAVCLPSVRKGRTPRGGPEAGGSPHGPVW
ncbi:M48 family metalloprotease [Streptomyces sp. PSKA54]|uniref:M48 family metalloprotease n=1 Tax=Streptomyces himalayensis subsp. aureolus TaxID=2758039 RepID=A0A7W2HHU7_9ACTN|nr:M48 family metalloprotease [Streptomyces himalayensis]MBA4864433.1 M48 family metalloprotease [Streptomyces himalayensis subsp. aureolus]